MTGKSGGVAELDLFEGAARIAGVAGWYFDIGSGRLHTSPDFGAIFACAFSEEPASTRSRTDLLPEPQRSVFVLSVARAARTGERFDFTTTIGDANGREVHARIVGEPERNDQGEVIAIRGAVQDVTAIRAEGVDQRGLERRLESRLDRMAMGIAFLDRSWRFSYVNETCQRYLQRPAAELLGRTVDEIAPEVWATPFGDAYRRAMEDRVVSSARGFYPPLGLWFAATAYPTDEGIAIQINDVTGDQATLLKLEESTGRLRQQAELLDAARDAITVCSLEGIVTYWNGGAERVYGWPREEAAGRRIEDLLQPQARPLEVAVRATLTRGHWTGELEKQTKEGRRILVDCRWQLLRDESGNPTAIFAVDSDITEIRRAEEERNRAQRMDSLGTLAAGIAHDVNNALTPVLLSAQILGMDEPDEHRGRLLQSISSGARRCADLLQQILSFVRGEEGRASLVDIGRLLVELDDFCRSAAPGGVEVRVEPASGLAVRADRTQLLQVLLNLAANAFDAMPGGGSLRVRAAEVQREGRAWVWFEVEDTGEGIPDEIMSRIFDPFFSTRPPGRGTGLGLSTTLGIVRRWGGAIDVASGPATGTRFTVRLPAAAEGSDEEAPVEAEGGGK